jgi:type II secretory pathway component PulK
LLGETTPARLMKRRRATPPNLGREFRFVHRLGKSPEHRGAVLITVLWIVLILAIVSFSLAASVRVEVAAAATTFELERAELLAKAGAELVYYSLLKRQDFPKDSPVHQENGQYTFRLNSGEVRVRLDSPAALININTLSRNLLESILTQSGVDALQRDVIVNSILDRLQAGPFRAVEELRSLEGVSQDLLYGAVVRDPLSGGYRRVFGLRDVLTVDSPIGAVDPNFAPPAVLRVLPGMTEQTAGRIIAERAVKPFSSLSDLTGRIPELVQTEALKTFEIRPELATTIVSQASILSSGASRTVRLLLTRNQTAGAPELVFGRWRLE